MRRTPPQPGLINVGGNFFATPPTPQPPNYSKPFSRRPIGFEFALIDDGCNKGIQINGILVYMRLPAFQFVWRNPECSLPEDPFELPPIHSSPSTTDLYWQLKYQPYYVTCREQVPFRYPELIIDGYGYNFRSQGDANWCLENKESVNTQILSVTGRVERRFVGGIGWINLWFGEVIYRAKRTRHQVRFNYSGLRFNIFGVGLAWDERFENHDVDESFEGIFKTQYTDIGWTLGETLDGDDDTTLKAIALNFGAVNLAPIGAITQDELPDAIKQRDTEKRKFREKSYHEAYFGNPGWTAETAALNTNTHFKYLGSDEKGFGLPYSFILTRAYAYTYIYVSDGTLNLSEIPDTNWDIEFKCDVPRPPAPLPPMRQECCDELREYLILLLKRVGPFPKRVPNTLLTENGVQPQETARRIDSISEFMQWHYERLDELMGEWESTVNVKDGDENEVIRLPNLAEAISEIFTLVLQNHTRIDTTLNIVTRVLLENASIKQQGFKSFKAIMAMVDWMNFQHKEEIEEMPLTCNPAKQKNFKELLTETDVQVGVINAIDKETLNEILHNLMFAASIIKGVHFRKTGSEIKDIIPKLKGDLEKMAGQLDMDEVNKWTNNLVKKNDA